MAITNLSDLLKETTALHSSSQLDNNKNEWDQVK